MRFHYYHWVVFLFLCLLASCRSAQQLAQIGTSGTAVSDAEPVDPNAPVTLLVWELDIPAVTLDWSEFLWDAPGVTDVRCTDYIHWIDLTENGGACMIALRPKVLRPEAVSGAWYRSTGECCVNQAAYDRLTASGELSGVGGAFTLRADGERFAELTVTGIVQEEGRFADATLYGAEHFYLSQETLNTFIAGYNTTNKKCQNDFSAFQPYQRKNALEPIAFREGEDGEFLTRTKDGTVYTRVELAEALGEMQVTSGFSVEVTLENRAALPKWEEYMDSFLWHALSTVSERVAAFRAQNTSAMKELASYGEVPVGSSLYNSEMYQKLLQAANQGVPAWYLAIDEEGEGDDWYVYGNHYHYFYRILQDAAN